ncbi:MAG: hypothetical protein IPI20_19260 [Rhodoferax sp.]|nr:hypothetical protein [Rhodoferax sp.]
MQFSILSATGGPSIPFTVGQAFRQGDVPASQTVRSGIADFQSVVKNRWPDGSVKFAILSGRADLSANAWRTIGLSAGPASSSGPVVTTQDLQGTGVSASVQFGSFGTAGWSGGEWGAPTKTWVEGPEMSAWTFRKPIGGDAHLVAWLEVRAYRGGRVEVLPWIENGYLKVTGPTGKSGTATFTFGGTQRFSQPLNLLNHQRAVLASGTTLTHWFGGDPQVTPKHDSAYLMATKLVPNYRAVTTGASILFNRLPSSYTPLAEASYPVTMGNAGYHGSIGLLPEWDAAYLTTGADPRAFRGVVINGYAAGRYGTHYRDETTNRPIRFSSYPTLVITGDSGIPGTGASSTNSYTPVSTGSYPPSYANTHHPSMGYMAYLLTGWNYFVEETQFVATVNYLKQSDQARTVNGLQHTTVGANTTRGAAWSIRSLAQAATIAPDGDPLRDEFVGSLSANISYYHDRYATGTNNPLGLVAPYSNYGSGDPWQSSIWMDDFFTATFGYLKELQAHSPAVQAKLDAFVQWKYRSIIGRLGGGGADSFSFRYAAQYTTNYAPSATSNWDTGTGPWYNTWGDVARSMSLPTSGSVGESLVSGYPEEASGYWGNLMPALAYAVDHNAAGAVDAWTRVISAPNFVTQVNTYNDAPVWGVKPRTR